MDYRCTSGKILQRIYVVGSFIELFSSKQTFALQEKEAGAKKKKS